MQFADPKTGTRFTGELIQDPNVDYRRLVLVLTPLDGGPDLRINRDDKLTLLLSEATLNEISVIDRAGFSFSLHPSLRHRRSI